MIKEIITNKGIITYKEAIPVSVSLDTMENC